MSLKINPKKFLVIGSNSFSGSHFVNQLLLKGNQVCGVSRSAEPDKVFLPYKWGKNIVHINDSKKTIDNFKFYSLDLNTSINKIDNLLDEFQPEYVVNFASQGMVAQSWLNPTHWFDTNE